MFSKKSQISLEFIMIFAIGMGLTLILGGLFYSVSSSEKNNLDINQITKIGDDLMDYSEQVYFRGSGNKIQYKANFPENIISLEIKQLNTTVANYSELRFGIISSNGMFQNISFNPTENYIVLNCSTSCNYNASSKTGWFNRSDYSFGPKTISVKSIGDQVLIDFVR